MTEPKKTMRIHGPRTKRLPKDEAREKIALSIAKDSGFFDSRGWDYLPKSVQQVSGEKADQILNISGKGWTMGIIATEEELPKQPWPEGEILDNLLRKGYRISQQDMLKAGYKRVIWQGGQD